MNTPAWIQKPVVQVAGVRTLEEARMLVECGVDWLGFPLRLDVHDEDLTDADAAAIVSALPRAVTPVLITYLDAAPAIAELAGRLGIHIVQLHGDVAPDEIARLRADHPDLYIMKSLIVRPGGDAGRPRGVDFVDAPVASGHAAGRIDAPVKSGGIDASGKGGGVRPSIVQALRAFEPVVDAFITDTFDPESGARGATGRCHDWRTSREIVRHSARPVILAGGLGPGNVAEAVRRVRPAGVDAHTGLEDPAGAKDRAKVRAFVDAARGAFPALAG